MSYCKKCGFQRGEGSGCDDGCEYEKPAVMTKTREEAEKLVRAITNKVFTRLMKELFYTHSIAEKDLNNEILNALYPKPESQRLKQLRDAHSFYSFKQGQTAALERVDLVLELIDAAIKEEEATNA